MIKLYKICTDILSPKYYAMFKRIQAILIFYCYVDLMCKLNYSNIHIYRSQEISMLHCSLYVSDIIRDLKQEISEHGTIKVLIKEIEKITSEEEQESFLSEENGRMQIILAELQKKIADKKTSNEKEEENLTRKLTLTRV